MVQNSVITQNESILKYRKSRKQKLINLSLFQLRFFTFWNWARFKRCNFWKCWNRINKEILVQYDPRKTFEAPVKKEYIIKAEPSVIKRIDDGPQKEDPEDSQNPPPSKRSKKNRGQNKHRAIFTVKKETKPCTLLFTTKTCDYDGCKNLHTEKELETYLQSKEPDIYDVCPVYEKLGYCSTGLSCRFGSSHIRDVVNICKHGCVVSINGLTRRGNFQNEEEQREVKTESAQVWGHQCTEKVSSQIMNVSDRNILQDLRKQKLSFVKAKEYLDKLSQGKASVDLANERVRMIVSSSVGQFLWAYKSNDLLSCNIGLVRTSKNSTKYL